MSTTALLLLADVSASTSSSSHFTASTADPLDRQLLASLPHHELLRPHHVFLMTHDGVGSEALRHRVSALDNSDAASAVLQSPPHFALSGGSISPSLSSLPASSSSSLERALRSQEAVLSFRLDASNVFFVLLCVLLLYWIVRQAWRNYLHATENWNSKAVMVNSPSASSRDQFTRAITDRFGVGHQQQQFAVECVHCAQQQTSGMPKTTTATTADAPAV